MPLKVAIIPVTPFQQNCSLVWCDETMKGALVDPGGELEKLMGAVESEGITLEKILCTHGHIDHVGGVAELKESTGLPIEGPHKDEAFWIDQLPEQATMFNFKPADVFTPDRWLDEGDEVSVGKVTFSVHHCPGHTPGHVVFFDKDARLAIVGDVLFQGSIGRTDFPRGNHADLVNAIKTKLWPMGDDVTFVPGHGSPSTFGQERASNPYVGDHVNG